MPSYLTTGGDVGGTEADEDVVEVVPGKSCRQPISSPSSITAHAEIRHALSHLPRCSTPAERYPVAHQPAVRINRPDFARLTRRIMCVAEKASGGDAQTVGPTFP